ncbi:hypothetical protein LINPERPRIM_LOCUS31581, partial [Linum perenne]
ARRLASSLSTRSAAPTRVTTILQPPCPTTTAATPSSISTLSPSTTNRPSGEEQKGDD